MRFPLWAAALLVAAVTAAVYIPSIGNGFVDWDDRAGIVENEMIRSLDGHAVAWMFSTFKDGNWIPLTWLSHALVYALAGLDPFAHHLANILLHALNALLVFFLFLSLLSLAGRDPRPPPDGAGKDGQEAPPLPAGREPPRNKPEHVAAAALAALFWAVHPLHVESVTWVTERKDLGNALFFLLALILYLGYASAGGKKRRRLYGFSLLFFVLSLLFKPMTVTFPAVILLLDWWPLGRLKKGKGIARLLLEKIPFAAVSLVFAVLAFAAQSSLGGVVAGTARVPLDFRVMNAFHAVVFYIEKTLIPVNLAPLYPIVDIPRTTFSAGYVLAALLVLAATAAALFLGLRRRPLFPAAWFYYAATLLPVLGLVQVGRQAAADRYTYLPSLGPALLAAAGVFALGKGLGRLGLPAAAGRLVPFLFAGWIGVLAVLCMGQEKVWKDSLALWKHQTKIYPGMSNTAYCNLACAYMAAGRPRETIKAYRIAMALGENHPKSHHNLGCALLDAGFPNQAVAELKKAIAGDPGLACSFRSLWQAYRKKGMTREALEAIRKAVDIEPGNGAAWKDLGISLLDEKNDGEAEKAFAKALGLSPGDGALAAAITAVWMRHGRTEEAVRFGERAVALYPKDAACRLNLGLALLKKGDTAAAIPSLKEAAALDGKNPAAFLLLGEALERSGDLVGALEACERAAALNNRFGPAHAALARILERLGKTEKARVHLKKALDLGAPVDARLKRRLIGS